MVVVKIEIWPYGIEENKRQIGEMRIANNLSGDLERGNYNVSLAHADGKEGIWKTGKIVGHLRKLSPYHLVKAALKATLK